MNDLRSPETRIVKALDWLSDHAALVIGTVAIVILGWVCMGAGAKSDGVPPDALQIQVTGLTGTKVILARETTAISARMGVMTVRYLGYHDNVWHQAGGVGVWIDVPAGPPVAAEEDEEDEEDEEVVEVSK